MARKRIDPYTMLAKVFAKAENVYVDARNPESYIVLDEHACIKLPAALYRETMQAALIKRVGVPVAGKVMMARGKGAPEESTIDPAKLMVDPGYGYRLSPTYINIKIDYDTYIAHYRSETGSNVYIADHYSNVLEALLSDGYDLHSGASKVDRIRTSPVWAVSEDGEVKVLVLPINARGERYDTFEKLLKGDTDEELKMARQRVQDMLAAANQEAERIKAEGMREARYRIEEAEKAAARIMEEAGQRAREAADAAPAAEQEPELVDVSTEAYSFHAADDAYIFSFSCKPADEIRQALKDAAFRWIVKEKVWRRKATANAADATRAILKQLA